MFGLVRDKIEDCGNYSKSFFLKQNEMTKLYEISQI
jgi:hypothetical protein